MFINFCFHRLWFFTLFAAKITALSKMRYLYISVTCRVFLLFLLCKTCILECRFHTDPFPAKRFVLSNKNNLEDGLNNQERSCRELCSTLSAHIFRVRAPGRPFGSKETIFFSKYEMWCHKRWHGVTVYLYGKFVSLLLFTVLHTCVCLNHHGYLITLFSNVGYPDCKTEICR